MVSIRWYLGCLKEQLGCAGSPNLMVLIWRMEGSWGDLGGVVGLTLRSCLHGPRAKYVSCIYFENPLDCTLKSDPNRGSLCSPYLLWI